MSWQALAWGLSIALQVLFAIGALVYAWLCQRRHEQDTEAFLTARKSAGVGRIAFAFFSGAMGAWVITSPSSYGSFAGIVGVVVYALVTGLPMLMIAFFGAAITRKLSHCFSLSDYVYWRFGPTAKTMVCCIAVFNMSINLVAEYSSIASIFKGFVGTLGWPIVLSVGILTLAYTAYGGLRVSIATDLFQGIASCSLFTTIVIYTAVEYRYPIPSPLPSYAAGDAFNLGPNLAGYTSIFTLTASLFCANTFSEALWQRVWASYDRRTLFSGASVGACLIILGVFVSGFGGWLAMAAGLVDVDTDPNLYLFQLFTIPGGPSMLHNAMGMVVVLLAVVMNESTVDSFQNGLASSISSQWLKNRPLLYSRIAVLLINVPLIIIGLQGYNVLSLFLITNLLCSCSAIPVLLGFWDRGYHWISETAVVAGITCGILTLTATGIALQWDVSGGSVAVGADWAWYGNQYDWRAFLAALCGSVGGLLLWVGGAAALRACGVEGPGISALLLRVPGMRFVMGAPTWQPPCGPLQPTLPTSTSTELSQSEGQDGKVLPSAALATKADMVPDDTN